MKASAFNHPDNHNLLQSSLYARPTRSSYPLTAALGRVPSLRLSQLLALPRSFVIALLPDLVRAWIIHEPTKQHQWTESSWMDGLRGIAALVVYNCHFVGAFCDVTRTGFGYDQAHMQPLSLPIIRLFLEGASAVCIFFTISGYVVSLGTFRLLANGQTQHLLPSISYSIFRRGFRLYLPMLCIMLLTALSAYVGLFEYTRTLMENPADLRPRGFGNEPNLKQYGSLKWQLSFLFKEFWNNTDILDANPFYCKHDAHLWTLRYEYRGSIFIYAALIGLAGCRPLVRVGGLFFLGFIQLILNHWDGPLFFTGAAFAQLSVLRKKDGLYGTQQQQPLHPEVRGDLSSLDSERAAAPTMLANPQPLWQRTMRFCLFGLALWLMSFPANDWKKPAPGYFWIHSLIPWWYRSKQRYPRTMGTLLLIYLLDTVPEQSHSTWMTILNCWPAQYLGRVMFPLYLVHGPLLHMIGFAFPRLIWARIGYQTYWLHVAGVTGGWILALLMCLWAAEVFGREILQRCIRFTKWVEGVCFVKTRNQGSEKGILIS